jgi:hypothetical protein
MDPLLLVFAFQIAILLACLSYSVGFGAAAKAISESSMSSKVKSIVFVSGSKLMLIFSVFRRDQSANKTPQTKLSQIQHDGQFTFPGDESELFDSASSHSDEENALESKQINIRSRTIFKQMLMRLNRARALSSASNLSSNGQSFGYNKIFYKSLLNFKKANLISSGISITRARDSVMRSDGDCAAHLQQNVAFVPLAGENYSSKSASIKTLATIKEKIHKLNASIYRKKKTRLPQIIYEVPENNE